MYGYFLLYICSILDLIKFTVLVKQIFEKYVIVKDQTFALYIGYFKVVKVSEKDVMSLWVVGSHSNEFIFLL